MIKFIMEETVLKNKKAEPSKYRDFALYIFTVLYALFIGIINFIRIFDNVFWGDEAYSIRLGRMEFSAMLTETASDVHPPLYYIFLSVLIRIFGDKGWVYHLSAFIPFVIVLIFICTFFYKSFGPWSSILFLTLMGLSDNAVIYNMEVRMYSLAFMFVLFSFYSFYYLIKDRGTSRQKSDSPGPASLFFVLFSLGAAYTHYYALLTVFFLYLVLFIRCFRKRDEIKRFLIIAMATVIGYIPWLIALITTFGRTASDYWMNEIPGIKDIIKSFYFSSDNKWYSYGMFAITVQFLFVCIIKYRDERKGWLLSGLFACAGTVLVAVMVSVIFRPVFTLRFIYPVASIMWVILAVSISGHKREWLISVMLSLLSCFVFIPSFRYRFYYEKMIDEKCSDTVSVIHTLENTGIPGGSLSGEGPGDSPLGIVTDGEHLDWTLLDYYVPGSSHEYVGSVPEAITYFNAEENNYLFWTEELTSEDIEAMSDKDYGVDAVLEGGYIGNWVNIYRVFSLFIM